MSILQPQTKVEIINHKLGAVAIIAVLIIRLFPRSIYFLAIIHPIFISLPPFPTLPRP